MALLRCTFAVASAMPVSWAICWLRRPRATCTILRSLGLECLRAALAPDEPTEEHPAAR
jgi:hypothetical protein